MSSTIHISQEYLDARIMDVSKNIPNGVLQICTRVAIYSSGIIDIKDLPIVFQSKVVIFRDGQIPTKQHKRHVGWERVGDELRIDLF